MPDPVAIILIKIKNGSKFLRTEGLDHDTGMVLILISDLHLEVDSDPVTGLMGPSDLFLHVLIHSHWLSYLVNPIPLCAFRLITTAAILALNCCSGRMNRADSPSWQKLDPNGA